MKNRDLLLSNIKKKIESYMIICKRLGFLNGLLFVACNNLRINRTFLARFAESSFLIRSCTNDLFILHAVFTEEYLLNAFKFDPVNRNHLIIDAGAHIGGSAHRIRKFFPQNRIVLIEPEISNFALLEKNVATLNNKKLVRAALVPSELMGQEIFLRNRTGYAGFSIVENPKDNPQAPIIQKSPTISLRSILKAENANEIAFIKIDVEGAEKAIFSTDYDLANLIAIAYIELHDRVISGCTETVKNFFKQTHLEFNVKGEKLIYIRKRDFQI